MGFCGTGWQGNFMTEDIVSKIEKHWEDLLSEGKSISFKSGQVLFYEGHSPYGVFILQKGRVKFRKREAEEAPDSLGHDVSESDAHCREAHGPELKKGRVLGVAPFIHNQPYCCTCVAAEDCQAIFVSKTQLTQI